MCPSAAHPMGTWKYFRDTGVIHALGENGTHLMNYYNKCLAPLVKKELDNFSVTGVITSRVTNIAKRMLENSLGIGELKVGYSAVKIMYHVYNLVEYLDNKPTPYQNAGNEVGAIVKNVEDIIG